jgi:hypothetical protein
LGLSIRWNSIIEQGLAQHGRPDVDLALSPADPVRAMAAQVGNLCKDE